MVESLRMNLVKRPELSKDEDRILYKDMVPKLLEVPTLVTINELVFLSILTLRFSEERVFIEESVIRYWVSW